MYPAHRGLMWLVGFCHVCFGVGSLRRPPTWSQPGVLRVRCRGSCGRFRGWPSEDDSGGPSRASFFASSPVIGGEAAACETHQLGRQRGQNALLVRRPEAVVLLRPVPVRHRAGTAGCRWRTQRRTGRLDPIHHLGGRHRLTLGPDLLARPGSAPVAAFPALALARRS